MIMIILSGNYPRHYNASNWNPYDSGTFISSASK